MEGNETMPLITVTQGAREGAFKGEDGVHAATLVAIEGPRSGVNKQTGEAYEAMDWVFAVDDAPDDASLVWASTSVASGPRSKMYGFLTALLGGKAPAVGQGFEAEDLVGRMALLTIRRDEEGWTRVETEPVKPSETRDRDQLCAGGSFGLLIQAGPGSLGGCGRLLAKRSGWAA